MTDGASFTSEDFAKAPKLDMSPALLDFWNRHVRMAPSDFQNALCAPPFGDCKIQLKRDFRENRLDLHIKSERPGDIEIETRLDFAQASISLNWVVIAPGLQGKGIGTEMTRRLFALAQKLDLHTAITEPALDNGGYTWARMGFMPTRESWQDLQENYLKPRLSAYAHGIPPAARAQLETAMSSDDPASIFLIAALTTPTTDIPAGRWLLSHSCWNPDREKPPSPIYAYKINHLRNTARNRLAAMAGMLPEKDICALQKTLEETPMEKIPGLVAISTPVSGIPLGKLMLVGTSWEGRLDFDNPLQAAIFNAVSERPGNRKAPGNHTKSKPPAP